MRVADLTVVNALIFDGSETLVEGSIRIVDGTIAEINESPGAQSAGEHVLDAHGRVVTPGLIDAHLHAYAVDLGGSDIEKLPLSYLALKGARRLGNALRRGFTTVRDPAGGDAGFARAIAEDLIVAPRYLYTGAALSQTGGHGDVRGQDEDWCPRSAMTVEVVDGVDALRRAARERFRIGAHAIKVMASGGVVSLSDPIRAPQYSAEELRAVVEVAEQRGSYVVAHAYSPEAIAHAVGNGVRSIEHGNLLDDDSAELIAQHGAFLVPTLAAYDAMSRRGRDLGLNEISLAKNDEVLASGQHAIEIARAHQVSIGFGSDLMGELENDQLVGFRLQAEVDGLTNALRSATAVNAQLLQRPDLGTIAVGAAGDLVIWNGNPWDNGALIWDESNPRQVIRGGVPV